MKKERSSSAKNGPTTKPTMEKIFGANPLQLGGENDASSLIGGIVEKGFSLDPQSTPEPRSTVLPFPVARHRSHGPHWAPRATSHDDVDDDGEDEDFGLYNPIGEFANPIQRKQKKGLDLTRWRELVNTDDSSVSRKKERNKVSGVQSKRSSIFDNAKPIDIRMEDMVSEKSEILKNVNMVNNGVKSTLQSDYCSNLAYLSPAGNCIQLDEMPQYGMEEAREEIMEDEDPVLLKVSRKKVQSEVQKDRSTSRLASNLMSNQLRGEHGATSIQNEIDVENRVRLEGMSVDEIVESQTELMMKMDPALIKMLKKRGLDKLKKKKDFSSEIGAGAQVGVLQDEKESLDASTLSEGDISDKFAMSDSKDTRRGVDSKVVAKPSPSNGSLWEVWSKNVEAARDLRFSLDGNLIENDSSQIPKTGNISAQSSYNSDNVAERDFLRTEGDPGAVGYTVKEALALTRSVVPGQRSLALHLLASVLGKSMDNICQSNIGSTLENDNPENFIYWEAVWAFALGPEPELALSLRMCLDDNHNSVVLACAKVIQCILCCNMNERLFDICEKTASYEKDAGTAPVFRSKPKIDVGFLQGGFWKYSSKPSNILPFGEGSTDGEPEGEHTIQDDVFVAGQDFVAGLVRMGILSRIRYLLEADPSAALEECLLSILIAIARHSPTCADAVMKCQRLVHVVVNRFTIKYEINFDLSKIKSVTLIRVLALSKKKCREFLKNGVFHKMTWHLYRFALSLDQWLNSGREKCKLSSALLVEQLRYWKVCIRNGYFVSNFADLFPALCNWLDVPTFEKLIEKNIFCEFAAVSREAFLVLEALTRTLPNFYSHMHMSSQTSEGATTDVETWCWSHVGPMVDLALKWIALERDPYLSKFFKMQKGNKNNSVVQDVALISFLWVISAVLKMLSGVLSNVIPEDKSNLPGGSVPWLPEFVPKIGLEIIKNGTLSFSGANVIGYEEDATFGDSFLKFLCNLRRQSDNEASIASVCCIDGLVQVVVSTSKLIQLANSEVRIRSSQGQNQPSREEKILTDGILEHALFEMRTLLTMFMKLIASEGRLVQSIEIFGRGGPAPGVGVGWGTSGGGFWSPNTLLPQMDARLLLHLLEIFLVESAKDAATDEEMRFAMQMVNCALDVCLVGGPRDRIIIDKMFDVLFQPHVLKCLDLCIGHFLHLRKGLKPFALQYKEENYLTFSNTLVQHYKSRWLQLKKSKAGDSNRRAGKETFKKSKSSLDTIHEDSDSSDFTNQQYQSTSLVLEWAHQRLPLPMHWFLSPLAILDLSKLTDLPSAFGMPNSSPDKSNLTDIARSGLFFLLGIEAMSTLLSSDFHSSIQCVPVVWKLHSLSVLLFAGMDILTDERSRLVYENLQEFYGQFLDKSCLLENREKHNVEFLKFQTEIHESYSTFTEALVEHFAGASYGDLLYGRQVAVYLHRCVEAPVRLAAWNALSNIHALELLPPLNKCVAKVEGYLEPVESDEKILEAYVKSWVSGALDRAVTRRSAGFTLVLHHLSLFIFGDHSDGELPLRNKLAKSLLRDYSRKPPHEGMMVSLIRYNKSATSLELGHAEDLAIQACEIAKRLELLKEACERNSSLLSVVEKLRSALG